MTKVVRAGEEGGHGGLDELLAFGVEVAGGFVEDEDLRLGEDGAGDGEALLLAAGELDDELVGVGAAGVFEAAVGDVVADGAIE